VHRLTNFIFCCEQIVGKNGAVSVPVHVTFLPGKRLHTTASLLVRDDSHGGRWRFPVELKAGDGPLDGTLDLVSAARDSPSVCSLRLPALVQRHASEAVGDESQLGADLDDGIFTVHVEGSLASAFVVEPVSGILPRDGEESATSEVGGTTVTDLAVLFRGRQKADAVLRVETNTRQWLYLLRGRLRLPLPAIRQATPRIVNK
jgi:hypothetical protein